MKEKAHFFSIFLQKLVSWYIVVCVCDISPRVICFVLSSAKWCCAMSITEKMLGKGTCVLLNTFKAKFSRTPSLRHNILLDRGSESPLTSSNSFIVVDWNGETLIVLVHSKLDLDDMSHNLDFFENGYYMAKTENLAPKKSNSRHWWKNSEQKGIAFLIRKLQI